MLDDEVLWLNVSSAPLMEVMVQNSIKDCPNVAVAEQVAKDITSRLAGGRVTIKDGCIYVG